MKDLFKSRVEIEEAITNAKMGVLFGKPVTVEVGLARGYCYIGPPLKWYCEQVDNSEVKHVGGTQKLVVEGKVPFMVGNGSEHIVVVVPEAMVQRDVVAALGRFVTYTKDLAPLKS